MSKGEARELVQELTELMAAFRAGESPDAVWKKLQTLSGKLQRVAAQGADDKELQTYLAKVRRRKREEKRKEKK